MKKLFTLLACIALLGGSTACSDKDDDARIDTALLLGTWQLTERYWADTDGEGHETVQPGEVIVRTFREDGTGTERYGQYHSEEFTYRTDEYLWFDYGDGDSSAYEVETLTNAVLVLMQSGSDELGDWLERDTYVRIE